MNLREFVHSLSKAAICFGVVTTLSLPATANAQAPLLSAVINLQYLQSSVAMASVNSMCVAIAYDKNGNRVTQTVATVTSTTTVWGSGAYGCFVWKL